jgi:hypothetical protein
MADSLREGGVTRLDRLDDGRVMCCYCFHFYTVEELQPVDDKPGVVHDACKNCWETEKILMMLGSYP